MNINQNIDEVLERLNQKHRFLPGKETDDKKDPELTNAEKVFLDTHKPERSLIVYGSLAPGKSNHSVVQSIKGKWHKGIVRGKIRNEGLGGYTAFMHASTEEQTEIDAYILISDELVANWPRLDAFEGEQYRRLLAEFQLENGVKGIGYIYALNEKITH